MTQAKNDRNGQRTLLCRGGVRQRDRHPKRRNRSADDPVSSVRRARLAKPPALRRRAGRAARVRLARKSFVFPRLIDRLPFPGRTRLSPRQPTFPIRRLVVIALFRHRRSFLPRIDNPDATPASVRRHDRAIVVFVHVCFPHGMLRFARAEKIVQQ